MMLNQNSKVFFKAFFLQCGVKLGQGFLKTIRWKDKIIHWHLQAEPKMTCTLLSYVGCGAEAGGIWHSRFATAGMFTHTRSGSGRICHFLRTMMVWSVRFWSGRGKLGGGPISCGAVFAPAPPLIRDRACVNTCNDLCWSQFSTRPHPRMCERTFSCGLFYYRNKPKSWCKFNFSPTGQNGRHFAENTLKCIFINLKFCILIPISLKFVPKGPIANTSALVQVMAWCQTGDKPLPEVILTQFTDAFRQHLGEMS